MRKSRIAVLGILLLTLLVPMAVFAAADDIGNIEVPVVDTNDDPETGDFLREVHVDISISSLPLDTATSSTFVGE